MGVMEYRLKVGCVEQNLEQICGKNAGGITGCIEVQYAGALGDRGWLEESAAASLPPNLGEQDGMKGLWTGEMGLVSGECSMRVGL